MPGGTCTCSSRLAPHPARGAPDPPPQADVLLISGTCLAQTAASYRQQAVKLSQKKSWEQAISAYQKAIALEPNDAATHYNLALALKYSGDAQHAVDEFQEALRLKPKWADAHFGLGAAFYDLHDQAAALKEIRTAVELDPANASAHRFLARIYSQQNDFSTAQSELRQALGLKPTPEMYFELGLVEGQLGNLDGAAAALRRSLRLKPRSGPAHVMLGVTLLPQGCRDRPQRSRRAV